MPFIGPLKGACPGLCPQKAWQHSLLENTKNKLMWHFSFDVRKTTKLCFSSKVAWAAIGWAVDTEPGLVCIGWIRQERAAAAT